MRSAGEALSMGWFWGAGGWFGPRSRLENWTNRRWWHFYVTLGVIGALVMFPIQYFGVVSNRSHHQLLPSAIGAIALGAVFGLGMFAFVAWARRKTGREEG
jgi:hypothetical protein